MDQSAIESLPIEILFMIFGKLTIKDLIKCSLVSRRFESVCNEMKVIECMVTDHSSNKKSFWFPEYSIINCENSIDLKKYLQIRSFFNLETNLKRLYLNCNIDLNKFFTKDWPSLEVLNIESGVRYCKFLFKFSNLKVLSIGSESYYDENRLELYLFLPKLEVLKISSLNLVKFAYPESIKRVELNRYENKLEKLKNLEHLRVNRLCDVNKDLLTVFDKIRKFEIFENRNSCFFHHGEQTTIGLRDQFVHILEQRISLNRLDFVISFQGII